MEHDLEIIYKAGNLQQASILKGILEDEGIDATVTNIALQNLGGLVTGFNSSPCVLVRRSDVEVARALAVDFEDAISKPAEDTRNSTESPDSSFAEDHDQDWDDEEQPAELTWPPCPQCEASRRGRCSNCGAFDDGFTPAEYLLTDHQKHGAGASATESFEVTSEDSRCMCSLCDEPVTPEPLRYCEDCGYDYGDGLVVEEVARSSLNGRTLLMLAFLAVIAMSLFAFYWISLR